MLKTANRATTMTFHEFKKLMATREPRCMDYFVKYDGFHLIAVTDRLTSVTYFTKWGTPLATGTLHPSARNPGAGRTLRAINAFLQSMTDRICPLSVERSDLPGKARQINFEFIAMRKDLLVAGSDEWTEGMAESLQDLFQGKCVSADETLNTVDYEYRIRIFDVTFRSNIPLFAKIEAAAEAYGPDMAATQIQSFRDLVRFLNGCEGVVAHTTGPTTQSVKIKVPCPVRARIIGVQNTLADFSGWNKILVAVENTQTNCLDAVCEIDHTEILTDYTRPSKGKVYANPKCVKYSPIAGTIVYELANGAQSTSAIAPTLNALYGLIGKTMSLPPIASTPTEATIRTAGALLTVRCGGNRSFSLTGYQYLVRPIDIVLGVNDIWCIGNNQLHLQAAGVLCLPAAGFGPAEFMGMPYTNEHTLQVAAARRLCRDRNEYYKLVGLPDGPFKDLAQMAPKLFCA